MKKISLRKNNEAQVLGLPMYLIIIMIVAVAVIAAVIFMMPQGSRHIDAQITSGSIISDTGTGEIRPSGDVTIRVVTKDSRADPLSGATVTLSGAGVAREEITNDNGEFTFTGVTAFLDANKNEDYITVTIRASGFEEYKDTQAIRVVRVR